MLISNNSYTYLVPEHVNLLCDYIYIYISKPAVTMKDTLFIIIIIKLFCIRFLNYRRAQMLFYVRLNYAFAVHCTSYHYYVHCTLYNVLCTLTHSDIDNVAKPKKTNANTTMRVWKKQTISYRSRGEWNDSSNKLKLV